MIRMLILIPVLIFTTTNTALAQEPKSGPQVGAVLPGPFHPFNINGEYGIKTDQNGDIASPGRHHCLVCDFGLRPTVIIFAKEQPAGQEKNLAEFLKELEKLIPADPDGNLRGFVVFLSPNAGSSVSEGLLAPENRTKKAPELVQQSILRKALTDRLWQFTKDNNLKNVIVSFFPATGPNGYDISDKTGVTVLLVRNYKVLDNFSFMPGSFADADLARTIGAIREKLTNLPKQ